MPEKLVAVIQARMGSSRLPGKVLKPILDKPVLWHIVNRLRSVKKINEIVVATSVQPNDNQIKEFCTSENIKCFRGSEDDVLDRFYNAASFFNATTLIRITGDCPLIDPILIKELIKYFYKNKLDFCGIATGAGTATQGFKRCYPDGLDAEIFKMKTLSIAWEEATESLYREHVTPFIWKHPERFKLGTLKSKKNDYSDLRWTIDNKEDYLLIKWIYENLYPVKNNFNMHDVLELLEKHPKKIQENKKFIGREGYEKFWT